MIRKILSFALIAFIVIIPIKAAALSEEELKAIYTDTEWYVPLDAQFADLGRQPTGTGNAGGGALTGCDNAEIIWNYLLGKNVAGRALTPQQVAGIMGNMQAESGFNPKRVQSTPTPEGDLDSPPAGSRGYGLVQWTPGTKIMTDFNRLRATFAPAPVTPGYIGFQLTLLLEQLNGQSAIPEAAAGRDLVAQTSTSSAAVSFLTKYERAGVPRTAERIQFAQDIFTRFSTGGGCPDGAVGGGGAGGGGGGSF